MMEWVLVATALEMHFAVGSPGTTQVISMHSVISIHSTQEGQPDRMCLCHFPYVPNARATALFGI